MATGPNPYNKAGGSLGREGQIIPPKSAKNPYPRGKSLPGYPGKAHFPSHANALERAALARARAFKVPLALRGLLSPLVLAELIGDLMFGGQFYTTPNGWETPAGWSECPTPSCGFDPDYFQWSSITSCAALAACPPSQVMAVIGSTANTIDNWFVHPTRRGVTFGVHTSGVIGTAGARYTLVKQYLRPASLPDGEPWAEGRVLPMPRGGVFPNVFDQPVWREKTYPRNRPVNKPKDRMFGDRLPPRGSTKYPDYPHVPPPPRVKEKKGLVIAGGRAAKIYGAATEFRDFADCLAANIPGNPCGKYRRQLHKYAYCIAMNEAKINMPEAMVCFFEKQSEDKHIGGTFGHVGGAAANTPNWIRPVGPQAGGWATPKVPKMTPI